MRKDHLPLWWYQYRYGTFHWTWKATAIVVLIVGIKADQVYEWSSRQPVCHKDADTVSSLQAQRIGPTLDRSQPFLPRCRDGWTDIGPRGTGGHHD